MGPVNPFGAAAYGLGPLYGQPGGGGGGIFLGGGGGADLPPLPMGSLPGKTDHFVILILILIFFVLIIQMS